MTDIQAFLAANPDYLTGSVIGNSGIYRREDESVDDYIARLTAATQDPGFGTAGRPVDSLHNAGFVNLLDPVTIDGVQYHRVGEDVSSPEWMQRFLSTLKPDAQHYTSQWDMSQVARQDPTYGGLMREPEYQEAVRLNDAAKSEGIWADNSPFPQIAKMILSAVGAGYLGTALDAAGEGALSGASFAADSPYWSMLADASGNLGSAAGTIGDAGGLWGNLYEQALAGTGAFSGAAPFTGSVSDLQGLFSGQGDMLQSIAPNFPGAQTAAFAGPGSTGLTTSSSWWDNLLKNPTSSIGKVLTGNGNIDDYLKIGGSIIPGLLGSVGADKQTDAFKELSDKWLNVGAPFRSKLLDSYAPGFSMMNEPGYKDAVDNASNSVLRSLSASVGNPYDSPGAVMEAQKYITGSTALPALQTYRSQLGSFGQLGTSQAGAFDSAIPGAEAGGVNAIGYGLNKLLSGNDDMDELLKRIGSGVLGGYGVNKGATF